MGKRRACRAIRGGSVGRQGDEQRKRGEKSVAERDEDGEVNRERVGGEGKEGRSGKGGE